MDVVDIGILTSLFGGLLFVYLRLRLLDSYIHVRLENHMERIDLIQEYLKRVGQNLEAIGQTIKGSKDVDVIMAAIERHLRTAAVHLYDAAHEKAIEEARADPLIANYKKAEKEK